MRTIRENVIELDRKECVIIRSNGAAIIVRAGEYSNENDGLSVRTVGLHGGGMFIADGGNTEEGFAANDPILVDIDGCEQTVNPIIAEANAIQQ